MNPQTALYCYIAFLLLVLAATIAILTATILAAMKRPPRRHLGSTQRYRGSARGFDRNQDSAYDNTGLTLATTFSVLAATQGATSTALD